MKRTGVALLAASGVDPSEITRLAGHTSVAFTYGCYGHLFPEVDIGAAAKLETLRNVGLQMGAGSIDYMYTHSVFSEV